MAAETPLDCPGKANGRGVVTKVIDGATLQLDSGQEIRLAGIEPPSAMRDAVDAKAASTLKTMAEGQTVEFRHASTKSDRYGRVVAQVFLSGGSRDWLEASLIGLGFSRYFATADSRSCGDKLLSAEGRARQAGLGLWGMPEFAVKKAADGSLAASDGLYALVEGRILSVGERTSTIYLDFGRDWSTDFTVTIPAKSSASFKAAGKEVKSLNGRLVRVRGWLTRWNGATIKVEHPDEIELLDERAEGRAGG